MAILDRVTFSGADDTTDIGELRLLSRQFPWIEWGILVSAQRQHLPRYPGHAWREHLADTFRRAGTMNLSVHVQGRWLRALLSGDGASLREGAGLILEVAQRVQFNFHGALLEGTNLSGFVKELQKPPLRGKQLIFQVDGRSGADVLEAAWGELLNSEQLDGVALYDSSAGAGVVPPGWPVPEFEEAYGPAYSGYAGGLGPDNLEAELQRIAAAAGKARIWIDMETGVRSIRRGERDYDVFDLEKVRRVIEICAPLVGKDLSRR